jgi:hypothetical protein
VAFKIGDRVRIVVGDSHYPQLLGTVTTVVGFCGKHGDCYGVDLPTNEGLYPLHVPGFALKLVYDGNETVSWSSCVWQPNQVRA